MKSFLARIKTAPGQEYEQAIIRLVIVLLIFFGVMIADQEDHAIKQYISLQAILFTLSGMSLLFWIYHDPTQNPLRYILSSGLDALALSFLMFYSGSLSGAFFPIYLWVIFGFGFRFGSRYLFISSAQSIVGFGIVYFVSDYWSAHPSLYFGLLASLIVLPAYVSTLLKRLEISIESANIANQAKSQFLANMTHELRTPLNGIFCSNDLLRTTALTSTQEEYVNSIEFSVQALLSLINDILDISKIESGKFESVDENFDLHVLLNSTVMMLKNHANDKGLDLQMSVMPDVPFRLYGDKSHTLQVLINLMGNAIKYTQTGSVKVKTSLVSSEIHKCRLRFEVIDTGIGIPLDKQDTLFERFTQVDNTDTRKYEGSGLGAAIAKELIVKLGGEIGLTSTPDKGSTFWFELPFTVRERDKNSDDDLTQAKVLILKDKEQNIESIKQALTKWNAEIVEVYTATQALNKATSSDKKHIPFSVLIVTKSLLEINLFEFTALLKRKEILDKINFICIADDISESEKQHMGEYGVDYILPSNIEGSSLFNVVHSAPLLRISSPSDQLNDKNIKPLKQARILVAEDNSANQFLFERMLTQAGFEVTMVSNGQEALDSLNLEKFDLCIMDMQMPVMSGVQAIKLFRYMQPDNSLPFIILTANSTVEANKACQETGANAFLTKPIRANALIDKIHSILSVNEVEQVSMRNAKLQSEEIIDFEQIDIFNSKDSIIKIISVFKNNLEKSIDLLATSIEREDYTEFKKGRSFDKGVSGNFGAIQLYKLAVDAENLSHTDFHAGVSDLIATIQTEIARACETMQDYSSRKFH